MPMFPRIPPRPRPRAGWPAAPAMVAAEGFLTGGATVPATGTGRGGIEIVGDGAEAEAEGTGTDPVVADDASVGVVDVGSTAVGLGMTPAFFHSSICPSSSLTLFWALISW